MPEGYNARQCQATNSRYWPLPPSWGAPVGCRRSEPTDDGRSTDTAVAPPDRRIVHGDLTLLDDADQDAIVDVVEITGNLIVEQSTLTKLRLPKLERVGGHLRVWDNPSLRTLRLPALTTVDGDLSLYANAQLPTLLGLRAVTSVGGTLAVQRMTGLADLQGLGALVEVGDLYLLHNTNLTSLAGLEQLQAVRGNAELWELYALHTAELPALTTIEGKLDVFDADALTTLSLPALTQMGALEVHQCDVLATVGAFPKLTTMPGELRVQYNDGLSSLAGLQGLTTLGSGTVRFNRALTELTVHTLAQVDGLWAVQQNRSLAALSMPALTDVRQLDVQGNDELAALSMPALQRAEGVLFADNPQLSSCTIEALLASVDLTTVQCTGNLDDGCGTWCIP